MRQAGVIIAVLACVGACSPQAPERGAAPATEAAPVAPAQVEVEPAAYRGAAVAGQVCAQCHDVGMGAGPAVEIGAPDFGEIAGRASSSAAGLAAWMQSNHPKMPNYLFSEGEVPDLAAYIMSLRPGGG